MSTIYLLIWFLIPSAGGDNILQVQPYASLEACRIAGDALNAASSRAVLDKKITTFGGTCFEVPVPRHIPGKDEA